LLDEIEEELAEVARGLHAEVDLRAALTSVVSASAVPATLRVDADPAALRPDRARALVFVAAEAVANATKHAAAQHVQVHLVGGRGSTAVRVRDDGRGGAREVPDGGLAGLRERVESVGGTFDVTSGPGGTTVVAQVPS
jgi:signal transduction histidine kinase